MQSHKDWLASFTHATIFLTWLAAKFLAAFGQDARAAALLRKVPAELASPAMLWLHANLLQRLWVPLELQRQAWEHFLARATEDGRSGRAWLALGDLLAEPPWEDGQGAIAAYQKAESAGMDAPRLRIYRSGDWDALPFLRTHPDWAFPVVVSVDLEVDPLENAPDGSRVFEIGAVRAKGHTILDTYVSYIKRDFKPRKAVREDEWRHALPEHEVAGQVRAFIGAAFVAGHNLYNFDARHLKGIGAPVRAERIVDTLRIARLLYPDSQHHNLGLLCSTHGITLEADERHTALPDARACAHLVHVLGDELAQRGDALLTGIRALVTPNGAFDRVLLQPRAIPANPTLPWALDPAPSPAHSLARLRHQPASQAMTRMLGASTGALVELDDPDGAYVSEIPPDARTLVAMATRSRLERMLAAGGPEQSAYILPNPETLLCPQRMRTLIDLTSDREERLRLFCLYQASHNHDAGTLYPLRLPSNVNDAEIRCLQRALRQACCPDDAHRATCAGAQAMHAAIGSRPLLLATHEALFHQTTAPAGDMIVVDDVAELATHLPEYLACVINSEQVRAIAFGPAGQALLERLESRIAACVRDCLPRPAFHERLALSILAPYLTEAEAGKTTSVLDELAAFNPAGADLAGRVRALMRDANHEPDSPSHTHAFWLDVWYPDDTMDRGIERWALRGLSADVAQECRARCWDPYRRHIACGPALLPGTLGTIFLERSLGMPAGLPRARDARAQRPQVWLPSPEALAPAGLLGQRKWAMGAGSLTYHLATSSARTIVATLTPQVVANALAVACQRANHALGRKVLAHVIKWSTTRMRERLESPDQRLLAFVSPHIRRSILDQPVEVEVSGPLRFLNTRDPLVAARMRVFASLYAAEGPFNAYLLPQALLELVGRLSSRASTHLVLDSRLMARGYRDEALHALADLADVRLIEQPPARSPEADAFLQTLGRELDACGLRSHEDVSDEDLYLVLRALWDTREFKPYTRRTPTGTTITGSQKDVIRGVLAGKDQLLIVPTGGGKSLCFQLPAVLYADEFPPKVTLVFSPLIALMANQVEDLNRKGIFSAVLINSTLSPAQRQEHLRGIQRGDYSIIYVAPEQIHSPGLRRALAGREVALVAIDEAHCLSQWGHDFRTDYFAVKRWMTQRLSHNQQRSFPILALTATARQAFVDPEDGKRSDQASTVRDIIEKLGLRIGEDDVIMAPTQRKELNFHIERIEPGPLQCPNCRGLIEARNGEAKCRSCAKRFQIEHSKFRGAVDGAKRDRLFALLDDPEPQGLRSRLRPSDVSRRERGLVYCAYRATTEQLAHALTQRFPDLRVRAYHAGMEAADRQQVLDDFTRDSDKSLDIVVATNAFGMGIDVRRLGFVIHFDCPGTLEAYYQEAGRAGRNSGTEQTFGSHHQAQCILLYHPLDLEKQRHLSRQNVVTDLQVRDVYDVLAEIASQVQGTDTAVDTSTQAGGTTEIPVAPAREIIVTQHDIAARAAIDEEAVGTALYYLEYHASAHGQPIVVRGENANRTWRLRWENGYEELIAQMPPSSSSLPLVHSLRNPGEFQLTEFQDTTVSMVELASSLRWSYGKLESELLNLARRHILAYACDGRLRWKDGAAQACTRLSGLRNDMAEFLKQADKRSRGELSHGGTAFVDLKTIADSFSSEVDGSQFTRFIFALSREDAEPLRVFAHFSRALRRPHPGIYECKLWETEKRSGRTINKIVNEIFDNLKQTIERLVSLDVSVEWQRFDILQVEPDYQKRQQLHRWLTLMDLLGLIRYQSDPSLGLALSISFLQPPVTEEELSIKLVTLRLKETYTKHKLKQIEAYAALETPAQRAVEFDRYFFAREPLVERIDPNLRKDLLTEQESVARLDGGYHLVEGAAGSGKTTTLVEHVKHLVYQRQVPLERIMLATHFHSAVSRIDKQLEMLKEDGSVALTATINAFGNRVFTQHRRQLRRGDGRAYYTKMPKHPLQPPKGMRYHPAELRVVSEALTLAHSGSWPRHPWPEGLRAPQFSGAYARNAQIEDKCLDQFRLLRQQGIFPTCLPTAQELQTLLGKDNAPERYAMYVTFLQLMGEKALYTFDDQILFALAILRTHPDVRKEYRRHYEHVIIDEFQDFTRAAALLLLEICGLRSNALLFGDRDQDIRSKNTSAANLFDEFRQNDACGRLHEFRHNFRSTQEILDLATYVRNWREPDEAKRAPIVAAHGSSGKKPVLLGVYVPTTRKTDMTSQQPGEPDENDLLLPSMLDATLEQMRHLEEAESGKVAIIAADSVWLNRLEHLLIARGESFSLLKHEYTYQSEHVRNALLVYLRLIADDRQDDEMVRLLRNCVVPYLDRKQIRILRSIARSEGVPLRDVLRDETALRQAQVAADQQASLEAHLALIARFTAESRVSAVVADIETITNNPKASLMDEDDKLKDVTDTIRDLAKLSIAEALAHVNRHVQFLEEHRGTTTLCLTTVDHAKSEEFDTVFLLGADMSSQRTKDMSRDKRRLYVIISRARKRTFILYNAAGQLHPILQLVPQSLFCHMTWPPEQNSQSDDTAPLDDIPF